MASARLFDTSLVNSDLREFTYQLLNKPLYLPDVLHDTKRVMDTAVMVFNQSQQPFALVDGKNKLGGVFYISDVVPGHEGVFYSWCWGNVITATTLPFMREYIEATADEYELCRMVARTPCQRCGHLLEHLRFTLEGRFKAGYKSGGRLHTLYQYRRLFGRR